MNSFLSTPALLMFLFFFLPFSQAQESKPTEPKTLKSLEAKDYGTWESLRGSTLSRDGSWLAYGIRRTNGENEMRLRKLGSKETETIAFGERRQFSHDNRWLAYLIGKSEKEKEKLKKAKKSAHTSFALRDLTSDDTYEMEDVTGFAFSEDGKFIALRRYLPKGEEGGADLVVRSLSNGDEMTFGNVSAYAWSDETSLLAMTLDSHDDVGNGVILYNATTGSLKHLDSKNANYHSLSWREDGRDVAFLRETKHNEDEDEDPSHVLVVWKDLGTGHGQKTTFDHRDLKEFPKGMRVVTARGIQWQKHGDAVFFSIADWENEPAEKDEDEKTGDKKKSDSKGKKTKTPTSKNSSASKPTTKESDSKKEESKSDKKDKKKEEEPKALRDSLDEHAGVDVWHAKDTNIVPRQKKTIARDRNKNYLCAFWLDNKSFVRLGDEVADSVTVFDSGHMALARDTDHYEKEAMFGPQLLDVFVVNTRSGKRQEILSHHKMVFGGSPDGNHIAYVKDGKWCLYHVENNQHQVLELPGKMINDESGVLTDENRPYGLGGWSQDSRFVYLYDKFDIVQVSLRDGVAKQLTDGKSRGLRYRLLDLDREEDFLDANESIYLSVYGETSKQTGFARLNPDGSVDALLLQDKRTSSLAKAQDAEVYAYASQAFDDSPDIFVTDQNFANPTQMTKTNPQQSDFAWGRSELLSYRNDHGEELQGALFYPADYQVGKKYPMIVYIYEKRSQMVHGYSAPSERSAYNPTVFTTQGYFVFQPDIVYRAQNPGLSALACVVPAVKSVVAKGFIDAKRIGLIGHSWGAYQTAFIVSHSDVFAAGIAGAPLTNMMSMSTNIYWNSGGTNARIFHESQGRMDKPFWRDVDTYIANSPIFGMDSLNTPLLIAFGNKDGAVDWHQGIEMYNAARLAEKQLVMLVYDGENHGLRKKSNQVDYHWRIREWFGHYLKGDKAKKWVTEGTGVLEREKELKKLDKDKKKKKKKKK